MYGKTLVIANPAARSGKASGVTAAATATLERLQNNIPGAIETFDVRYTVGPKDATQIAAHESESYKTVLAIGGDGLVNEVANGLMFTPRHKRPALMLLPCGNGDDFARSIGMSRKPIEALEIIEHQAFRMRQVDIGNVNGQWFLETVSFGLDAAIALGTESLRKKTNRTGTSLYLQCGLDQVTNHRDVLTATVQFDGEQPKELQFYLLACQNGPSYGGGFLITPEAHLNDGKLDICYAVPTLSAAAAVKLLMKAKKGKHTNSPNLRFKKASRVQITLNQPAAVQVDGEALPAHHYDIQLHTGELQVLMPHKR